MLNRRSLNCPMEGSNIPLLDNTTTRRQNTYNYCYRVRGIETNSCPRVLHNGGGA
jgi:hypothetical protein